MRPHRGFPHRGRGVARAPARPCESRPSLRRPGRASAGSGITLNLHPVYPFRDGDGDVAKIADGYYNRWFLDPVFTGEYPVDMLGLFAAASSAPDIQSHDRELLARQSLPISSGSITIFPESAGEAESLRSCRAPEASAAAIPRGSPLPFRVGTGGRCAAERRWDGKCTPTDCSTCWYGSVKTTRTHPC